jgi:hypothetical protein
MLGNLLYNLILTFAVVFLKRLVLQKWKEYFESVFTGNLDDTDSVTFFTAGHTAEL